MNLPRRSSSSRHDADDEEKATLLETLIPAPTHPRASYRVLALGIITVFLLFTLWQGANDTRQLVDGGGAAQDGAGRSGAVVDASSSRGQGWVYPGQANPQQGKNDDGRGSETWTTSPQNGEGEDEDQDEDPVDPSSSSLDEFAKYLWHRDLEWDAAGSGRLIIVGDVHGMLDALRCV